MADGGGISLVAGLLLPLRRWATQQCHEAELPRSLERSEASSFSGAAEAMPGGLPAKRRADRMNASETREATDEGGGHVQGRGLWRDCHGRRFGYRSLFHRSAGGEWGAGDDARRQPRAARSRGEASQGQRLMAGSMSVSPTLVSIPVSVLSLSTAANACPKAPSRITRMRVGTASSISI
jgi:hypothetical protein